MYKTKYDTDNTILKSFLDNDCPMSLKDSNNETIVYHMIRNYDHEALQILFQKQKEKNFEMNNLNFYNRRGYSPLYLSLQYDLLADSHSQDDDAGNAREKHYESTEDGPHIVDDETDKWRTQMIDLCVAQKYEYNTASNIIRFKLNCILMDMLAAIQRHRALIHTIYECIYQCKKGNVAVFQSTCNDPNITQLTEIFKSNDDMEALLSAIQRLLNQDCNAIADFGPHGRLRHYFGELIDDYDRKRVQNIIERIEKEELKVIDEKVRQYLADYPFINELKPYSQTKIQPRSSWMYSVLLDNGADVNSPCFDSDNNANQTAISPLGFCLITYFDSLNHIDVIQDLVARNAKVTQTEMSLLSEAFVRLSAKNVDRDEMHMYFGILENIVHNSSVSMQHVTDLECNNPIHITIIHREKYDHVGDDLLSLNPNDKIQNAPANDEEVKELTLQHDHDDDEHRPDEKEDDDISLTVSLLDNDDDDDDSSSSSSGWSSDAFNLHDDDDDDVQFDAFNLQDNNASHAEIIHHCAYNDTQQTRILARLLHRYPFWAKQR
eukprot:184127_1